MSALMVCCWRWFLAIVISISMMQPVEWCDCCGEMFLTSELSQEVDYGEHYHGRICQDCTEFWQL